MIDPADTSGAKPPAGRKAVTIALLMILLIIAFYLVREHWGHVAGLWPYLLLLACPLMHLFHGRGGHAGHAGYPGPDKSSSRS